MPELLKYRFPNLSIHDAIIVQSAIEMRQVEMSKDLKEKSDRAIKAVLGELDIIYGDLDAHIASIEREQYFYDQEQKRKKEADILK